MTRWSPDCLSIAYCRYPIGGYLRRARPWPWSSRAEQSIGSLLDCWLDPESSRTDTSSPRLTRPLRPHPLDQRSRVAMMSRPPSRGEQVGATEVHRAVQPVWVDAVGAQERFRALRDAALHAEPGEELLHGQARRVGADGVVGPADHPGHGGGTSDGRGLAPECRPGRRGSPAEEPPHRRAVLDVEELIRAAVTRVQHLLDHRSDVVGDACPLERLVRQRGVVEVLSCIRPPTLRSRAFQQDLAGAEVVVVVRSPAPRTSAPGAPPGPCGRAERMARWYPARSGRPQRGSPRSARPGCPGGRGSTG